MAGSLDVAQAGSNTTPSKGAPIQIIKVVKPEAGHTEVFHASFTGTVKIDFTAIASERITLYHDQTDQTLHIIFTDGSQAIIEPFFDSMGVLSNLMIEVAPGQDLNGAQFASQFPITEDQSVLPAAGPGAVGNIASGADFHGFSVDPLPLLNPLPLLPPEELPPIEFHNPEGAITTTVPTTVSVFTALPLLVDESFIPGSGSQQAPSGSNVAAEDFSVAFSFSNPVGVTTYGLSFTSANTGLIDTLTGTPVTLFQNGAQEIDAKDGQGHTVFTLVVDSSGHVTLTDLRGVHEDGASNTPDDSISLPTGLVTLTATNNGTTGTVDVGALITIKDDGPSASLSLNGGVTLAVDETAGQQGPDTAAPAGTLGQHTISGATLFTSTVGYGSDGPLDANHDGVADAGATNYVLSILSAGATGLTDTLTGSAIVLVDNGGVIEGHVGSAGGLLSFTLSIDSSSGDMTLTQYRAMVQPDGTNPDGSEGVFLNSDLVSVTLTVTDGDGDTASSSAVHLNNVVEFLDDGPTASFTMTATTVSIDESAGTQQNDQSGAAPSFFTALGTPIQWAQIATGLNGGAASGGSDGIKSVSYALTNSTGAAISGLDSGFQATHNGAEIFLFTENGLIVGREGTFTGGVWTANAAGTVAFAIALDGTNLDVAQYEALIQDTNSATPNDFKSLSGLIYVTQTVTDGDNDTATATSPSALTVNFFDDGPTIGSFEHAFIAAQNNQIANGTYSVNFGADGESALQVAIPSGAVGATGYTLTTTDTHTTYNGNEIYQVVVTGNGDNYSFYYTTHDVGGSVELDAYFTDTSGTLSNPYFTLLINPDGTYTFDLESVGILKQVTVSGADFKATGGAIQSLTSPDGELTITGTDSSGGTAITVKGSNNGIAVGSTGLSMDTNEDLHLHFNQEQVSVGFILTQWQGNGSSRVDFVVSDSGFNQHFNIDVLKFNDTNIKVVETSDSSLLNGGSNIGASGAFVQGAYYDSTTHTYTLYVDHQFNDVQVNYLNSVGGNATFTVNSISYDEVTTVPSTDLLFNVTAVDGDGDTSTSSLQVDLQGGSNVQAGVTLNGTAIDDVLVGGGGNDTLTGGGGADSLTGGGGSDVFKYTAITDSTWASHDVIKDFDEAHDLINFSGFGAAITTISSTALTGAGDSLAAHTVGWYNDGTNTYVVANTSNIAEQASAANMAIMLTGLHNLTTADFQHS